MDESAIDSAFKGDVLAHVFETRQMVASRSHNRRVFIAQRSMVYRIDETVQVAVGRSACTHLHVPRHAMHVGVFEADEVATRGGGHRRQLAGGTAVNAQVPQTGHPARPSCIVC
jgi:hypothetical protein